MARKSSQENYANQIASLEQRIEKHKQNIETLTAQKRTLEDKQRSFEIGQLKTYMDQNHLSVDQVLSTLEAVAASTKTAPSLV